ncbi:MAG: hypothetical protein KDB27_02835, partial [Planctomycetales bacterium]|nr:hypothetical protein [Planctomycetales bacterium]
MLRLLASFLLLFGVTTATFAGVRFHFDYQYDDSGFFDDPARRDTLEMAGQMVLRYADNLAAIEPDEEHSWSAIITPPNTGGLEFVGDFPVAEDTIIVYVGARETEDLAYAIGSGGTTSSDGDFALAVRYRGQAGAAESPPEDVGVWGGTLTFSQNMNWHFGIEDSTLQFEQFDFMTVAMHELTHLLGVGQSPSFNALANFQGRFTGPEAVDVSSPTNRILELDELEHHFRENTKSRYGGRLQQSLMEPGIPNGERLYLTQLDRAVLRDIGWEEATPGDANTDRVFDSGDLVTMFQGAKYETGKLASWADGDFNDNGRFTSQDLVLALAEGNYVTSATSLDVANNEASNDATVEITYDAGTGDLSVNASAMLSTLQINSAAQLFRADAGIGFNGIFDVLRADKLFRMAPGGLNAQLSLGSVLPTGLSEDDLLSDIQFD